MCTFCSDLPSNERGSTNKAFITLFLKPNDPNNEKEAYRFRILNFRSPSKNNRAYPFISRYVHNHWGTNEKGIKIVDDYVVCPSTQYIDAKNDMDLGFVDTFKELSLRDKKPTWDNICPVCRHVAESWNAWKSSGKTDKVALQRIFSMQKQFQGVVPVYVVNDPINEKNNGRFKCIIFNNQDEYKQFIELVNTERAKIKSANNSYNWCNGINAVDFFIRMEKVPVVYNSGKPNEKTGTTRKITKMMFGKKAYDLLDNNGNEIVTKEAIDKFEFDDQYFTKNTKSEIEEFYKKHYSFATSNVPDEDIDDISNTSTQTKTVQSATVGKVSIPTNPNKHSDIPEIDDLATDSDDLPFDTGDDFQSNNKSEDTEMEESKQSIDELLNELNFGD